MAGQRLCTFLIEHRWCGCMLIFSHFSPQLWCMSFRCIWEKCYIFSESGTFEVVLLCACHYTIVSLFRKLLIAQLLIFNYACAVRFFCYELVCLSLSGWVLPVLTWVTSCRYVILSFMYGLTVSYFKTCIYALLRQWHVFYTVLQFAKRDFLQYTWAFWRGKGGVWTNSLGHIFFYFCREVSRHVI